MGREMGIMERMDVGKTPTGMLHSYTGIVNSSKKMNKQLVPIWIILIKSILSKTSKLQKFIDKF